MSDADATDVKDSKKAEAHTDSRENNRDEDLKLDSKSMEMIRELREEAKANRLKHKAVKSEFDLYKSEVDSKIKTIESEKETLNSRVQKLTSFEKRIVEAEVKTEAVLFGIKDTDLIKLIDIEDIKISEDGSIDREVVKNKISELKEKKPFLFGEEKRTLTSTNSSIKNSPENKKPDALAMTDSEYSEAKKRLLTKRYR